MNESLKFELNIALIPAESLAAKHIAVSRQLAALYPAVVRLTNVNARLTFAPHLTLYQVSVPANKLETVVERLAEIAKHMPAPAPEATRYAYNADEASFELQHKVTDELLSWQHKVIGSINPLRADLLLERDPAGHDVSALLQEKSTLGDNIRQTGYAEVGNPKEGGLFRPHVTLNWFEIGTEADEHHPALPSVSDFTGCYQALGVYLLGPYGTCPQRLAQFRCRPML